jgi:hypothetical protein
LAKDQAVIDLERLRPFGLIGGTSKGHRVLEASVTDLETLIFMISEGEILPMETIPTDGSMFIFHTKFRGVMKTLAWYEPDDGEASHLTHWRLRYWSPGNAGFLLANGTYQNAEWNIGWQRIKP